MSTPAPDATADRRPLRRDAERNRQRILQAAREVFAERGLGVTLDEIARHAGVGVGTVYRRFADKEALIDALFEDRIGVLDGLRTRREGPSPLPVDALDLDELGDAMRSWRPPPR